MISTETSGLDRLALRASPLLKNECSPSGTFLAKLCHRIYHSTAGLLEMVGYPSPKRHENYLIEQLNIVDGERSNYHRNILLLGAMSPSSILDILDIINKSKMRNTTLTVIDLCRTPLSSGKDRLSDIAKKMDIRLNLIQSDVRQLPFTNDLFDTIIADQLYNFIPPENWTEVTTNILNLIAQKGRLVNVIATYKDKVPFFGKRGKESLSQLKANYPQADFQRLSPSNVISYIGVTSLINDQTGISICKE